MKKLLKGLLICSMALLIGSTVYAADKTYKIKFGYITPELTPEENFETANAYAFRDYVQEKSNGRIEVQLFPAGQLGNFGEMAQSVINGDIEVAIINTIPMSGFYKKAIMFGMPGVFSSMDECNEILNTGWGADFNSKMEKKLGINILAHYSVGFRHFTNSVKEVKLPGDAKGLTFRVMESPVSIKMVEALGANPVPIPSSEMYLAMQNKVVDGQENPIGAIIQDRTYEVQKYLVLDGHFTSAEMTIINGDFYNSLPDDLKTVIDEAGKAGMQAATKTVKEKEVSGLKFLQEQGMTVTELTEDERAQWLALISKPTEEYVRSKMGDEEVDALLNAVKEYRK